MPPTENNMKLLEQYSMVSSDLGQGIVKPFPAGKRGAGDISHIAGLVSANLVGLGPIGMGTHSVIETMELNSLPIQSQRAALLMYRLTR
jgi:glutamate carboxypeptidase